MLIPVVNVGSVTNFYLGFQTVHAASGFKKIEYVEPLFTTTLTSSSGANGQYGPTVSSSTVGQTVTNLNLFAKSPSTLTVNSANNIGAGFSYFSEWDYFRNSTWTGWTSFGTCQIMRYLFYKTNYDAYLSGSTFTSSYKYMSGIVCHCDTAGTITNAVLIFSTGYLPSMWGISLPGNGAISMHTGQRWYFNTNYQNVGGSLTVTNITYPVVGPNMVRAVGSWYFTLPAPLDRSVRLTIAGITAGTNLPFTFVSTGTCAIYYNG